MVHDRIKTHDRHCDRMWRQARQRALRGRQVDGIQVHWQGPLNIRELWCNSREIGRSNSPEIRKKRRGSGPSPGMEINSGCEIALAIQQVRFRLSVEDATGYRAKRTATVCWGSGRVYEQKRRDAFKRCIQCCQHEVNRAVTNFLSRVGPSTLASTYTRYVLTVEWRIENRWHCFCARSASPLLPLDLPLCRTARQPRLPFSNCSTFAIPLCRSGRPTANTSRTCGIAATSSTSTLCQLLALPLLRRSPTSAAAKSRTRSGRTTASPSISCTRANSIAFPTTAAIRRSYGTCPKEQTPSPHPPTGHRWLRPFPSHLGGTPSSSIRLWRTSRAPSSKTPVLSTTSFGPPMANTSLSSATAKRSPMMMRLPTPAKS